MTTHIHEPCGNPMSEAVFAHNNPTPQYRSQPIWDCFRCQAFDPDMETPTGTWVHEPR